MPCAAGRTRVIPRDLAGHANESAGQRQRSSQRLSLLFREPLVHFLAIGAGIFGLYSLLSPDGWSDRSIRITQDEIANLEARHLKLWDRPPSPAELNSLIESDIRDEITYREGVKLGLARDDTVIKRRVRQKYELLTDEEAAISPPDQETLQAYLSAHPEKFSRGPIIAFRQILLPLSADINQLKSALAKGAKPERLGAPSLLPTMMDGATLDSVSRDFGNDFAKDLMMLPKGRWSGPIGSSYGSHLVFVDREQSAQIPPLKDIQSDVLSEWENDRQIADRENRYRALRRRYNIIIEAGRTK